MMASRKKKQQSGIVRSFEVSDPTLHHKGHTIYKVTQMVIKVGVPEEDVQEVIVWRRYNDFKKLYKAMVKLHEALHRNEEFPPFVEAKVFGRFEEEVIKRRMLCGQDLLNFVGQRHYLVASRAFQQFFQDGELRKYEGIPALLQSPLFPDSSDDDLLYTDRQQPDGQDGGDLHNIESLKKDSTDGLLDPKDGFPRVPSYNQFLGGVWQYRQIAEEISLGGDEDDDQTDYTDDSALSTPIPDSDMIFFDPMKQSDEQEEADVKDELTCSNEWLLSQVMTPDVATVTRTQQDEELKKLELEFAAYGVRETQGLDDESKADSSRNSTLTGSVECSVDAPQLKSINSQEPETNDYVCENVYMTDRSILTKSKSGAVVDSGKGDLVLSPVHKQKPVAFNRPLHSLTSTPCSSPQHSAKSSPQHSPARHGLINIEIKDKADYIFLAANQISLAQQCEANNNYHMAFSYYKSAVGIMLTGVQKDDNKTRREVVRKKTAKYLVKAETLYHLYLDSREPGVCGERWDTAISSPAKELDPNVAFIQGSLSELKTFKVLGIIDKVLLIIDIMTDKTYVIKVLHKTCSGPLEHRNIVPIHLPYMVQLHKYYETENAIYLLLQHASGGRLWNYISGYFQQHNSDADLENILNDPHEKNLRTRSNTDDSDTTITGCSAKVEIPMHESQMAETGLVEIGQNGVHFNNTSDDNSEQFASFYCGGGEPSQKVTFDTNLDNSGHDGDSSFARKDSDGFSLEGSQDSSAFPKALSGVKPIRKYTQRGVSQEGAVREGDNDDNDTMDQFGDLLQGTRSKPSLEQFSINSFDSDSGPGSRFESNTSDYIESIPELNEKSPPSSPLKIKNDIFPQSPDDVFSAQNEASSDQDHDIIQSAICIITETSKELEKDAVNKDNGNQVHTQNQNDITKPADIAVPDLCVTVTTVSTPEDEPSIYDKYKEHDTSDSHSDGEITMEKSETTTGQQCVHDQMSDLDTKTVHDSKPVSHSTPCKPTISSTTNTTTTTTTTDLHSNKIRCSNSQVKGSDDDLKPRRRHLSSLFGSFSNFEEGKVKAVVRLPEGCVRQWAADLVVALASLHSMGIICRVLKPTNLLLGDEGHILLTYFCQWNLIDQEVSMEARDLLYSAPEVGSVDGETPACDWWSLGALLYELLTGRSLSSSQPSGVTSHSQLHIPDDLSNEAQAILIQLLKYNPEERLGAGAGGVDDIKMHPFFMGIDWTLLQG